MTNPRKHLNAPRLDRRPVARIVKRDGSVENFNRAKMIQSIRSAGATPQEANLVTSRVAVRLRPRTALPSKDVSTMVARSLSHVNSTASRNYVDTRNRKLAYDKRVNQLASEIAGINRQVNGAMVRIDNLDDRIQSLPGRIARIRQGNYRLLTHLEKNQAALSEEWAMLNPELRSTTSLKSETVRTQVRELQQTLSSKGGASDYNLNNLQEIDTRIPQARFNLSEIQSHLATTLAPLEQKFEDINVELSRAEGTLSVLEGASFAWEEGESPILAVRAKELDSDNEGFLTLTNLKFVFENEKEVVLKKKLFVVTEKKVVREAIVQKPIGMVTSLVQGKVGFFKGAGLFVKFASEAGIPELKFDTTGQDAEWVVKCYNYVVSGQADNELATVISKEGKEKEAPQLVTCPVCGAPYTEKVYRGQTSINCKYCGAVISLK